MEWSRTVWHPRKIWSSILLNSWATKIHNFQSEKIIICTSEIVQDFFCKLDMKPDVHFFRKQSTSLIKEDQVSILWSYWATKIHNSQSAKKWRCIRQFLIYISFYFRKTHPRKEPVFWLNTWIHYWIWHDTSV